MGPANGRPSSWICVRYQSDCKAHAEDGKVLRSNNTSEYAANRTFHVAFCP